MTFFPNPINPPKSTQGWIAFYSSFWEGSPNLYLVQPSGTGTNPLPVTFSVVDEQYGKIKTSMGIVVYKWTGSSWTDSNGYPYKTLSYDSEFNVDLDTLFQTPRGLFLNGAGYYGELKEGEWFFPKTSILPHPTKEWLIFHSKSYGVAQGVLTLVQPQATSETLLGKEGVEWSFSELDTTTGRLNFNSPSKTFSYYTWNPVTNEWVFETNRTYETYVNLILDSVYKSPKGYFKKGVAYTPPEPELPPTEGGDTDMTFFPNPVNPPNPTKEWFMYYYSGYAPSEAPKLCIAQPSDSRTSTEFNLTLASISSPYNVFRWTWSDIAVHIWEDGKWVERTKNTNSNRIDNDSGSIYMTPHGKFIDGVAYVEPEPEPEPEPEVPTDPENPTNPEEPTTGGGIIVKPKPINNPFQSTEPIPDGHVNAKSNKRLTLTPNKPEILNFGGYGVGAVSILSTDGITVSFKANAKEITVNDPTSNLINNFSPSFTVKESSRIYTLILISDTETTIQWVIEN